MVGAGLATNEWSTKVDSGVFSLSTVSLSNVLVLMPELDDTRSPRLAKESPPRRRLS